MVDVQKIRTYMVLHYGGPYSETNEKAKVILKLMNKWQVIIYFLPMGTPLKETIKDPSTQWYEVYFSIDTLFNVVDSLRNEKPCYFFYNHSNKKVLIRTSNEPVGEEET